METLDLENLLFGGLAIGLMLAAFGMMFFTVFTSQNETKREKAQQLGRLTQRGVKPVAVEPVTVADEVPVLPLEE